MRAFVPAPRIIAALAALLAACIMPGPPAVAAVVATDVSELLPTLLPSVVSLATRQSVPVLDANGKPAADGSTTRKEGVGSGFIIDPDGIILTNRHDTDGADEIDVILYDGTKLRAALMYRSAGLDLAILRIHPPHKLPTVKWGDSVRMLSGMPVIVVGNPLGLGFTATSGIVSARDRDIKETQIDNFIQIDAAINPGNSGGPVFNIAGQVIGMTTALFTPGQERGSVGLGFAIPANELQFVVNELKQYGRVRLGTIGVDGQDLDQSMADAVGLPHPEGVVLSGVTADAPAASAGLEVGDVILRIGDRNILNVRALRRTVASAEIGATVPVDILRAGARLTLQVHITEAPRDVSVTYTPDPPIPSPKRPANFGATVQTVAAADRKVFGIPDEVAGVVVTHVTRGTIATDVGLAAGTVILRVDTTAMTSPETFANAIDEARAHGQTSMMLLVIDRDAAARWMAAPVPPAT